MGSLIDEGSFGCIFHPGFNCDGEKNNDYDTISKLVVNEFNAINETFIGSLIQAIPNYKLFFLPVIQDCSIDIFALDKELIQKCSIINNNILQSQTKYLLLTIPYLKKISMRSLFKDSSRSNKYKLVLFIETFNYFINSLIYLLSIQVVHFDISIENIIYSTVYEVPALLDFGLSFQMSELNNSNISEYFYTYAPEHELWSLEIHAISYLAKKNDKLDEDIIIEMVDKYVDNNKALFICSDDFKNKYKEQAKLFLNQFISYSKYDAINALLKYYKKWDLYSTSILYLRLLFYICNGAFFENKLLIYISQILLTNISPDPAKRYSVEETKKKWRDMFNIDDTPQDYLMLINNLKAY